MRSDSQDGEGGSRGRFGDIMIKIGSERIPIRDLEMNRKTLRKVLKSLKPKYRKFHSTPLVLAMAGLLLLSLTFLWNLYLFPALAVIPEGLEMSVTLEGGATLINETTGEFSDINVTAVIATSFGNRTGDLLEVTQTISMVNSDTGEDLIAQYEGLIERKRTFFVNRRTGRIRDGGQLLLPMGDLEKGEYPFYNLDTDSTGMLRYKGKGESAGVETYRYELPIRHEYLGKYQAMGPVPSVDVYFNGNTTYWFEHRTGIPVDARRDMDLYADLPELVKVPDKVVQRRCLVGKAVLADLDDTTKKKHIDMKVNYNITTVRQLGETLVVWENMTGYNADTGQRLPEIYQLPGYERLISVNQFSAAHVYDSRLAGAAEYYEREGQWMFSLGRMNGTPKYNWFNQMTNTTMENVFQGREMHEGEDTYHYRLEADNYTMKPQDSKLENMLMIYDGYQDYWANVQTGIIHDIRINFTFSVLTVNEPKAFEKKIPIASVDVRMGRESLEESRHNLTLARAFFPHSNEKMTVFSAHMEVTEESREELADTAGPMSLQMFIGDNILPYSLLGIGLALLFFGGYLKRKRDILYVEEK